MSDSRPTGADVPPFPSQGDAHSLAAPNEDAVRRAFGANDQSRAAATNLGTDSSNGTDSNSGTDRSDGADPSSDHARARRRRGSRGGRGRSKRPGDSAPERAESVDANEYDRRPADLPDRPNEGVASSEAAARAEVRPRIGDTRQPPSQAGGGGSRPPRDAGATRSGSGGKKNQKSRPVRPEGENLRQPSGATDAVTRPGAGVDTSDVGVALTAGGKRNANKRGRRRRGGSPSESQEIEPVLLDAETLEKRRGRERNGRPLGRYLMCVHSREKATQIAVLEGRSLIEHYVSRPADNVNQIHGSMYLGRVQNVLPGMEAAFVDIGTPKNAVLYRGDVSFDAGDVEGGASKGAAVPKIEDMLKNRQMVLCQVTKNPIGSKGARLTQEVSLPGRFVVLVPNSDTYGISKRLPDDERKRLRRILDEVRPTGHGMIVRTAAEGATADELRRDVAMLVRQWDNIDAKAKRANGPTLLYREPDMAVRVIREEFNRNYRGVIIDNAELYEEVRSYVESISPELADRVEFYDAEAQRLPLFEKHHVHEQLHKAIDRKVWLPSGGSLIIERTEALTVIDVNTGKNVGSSSLEETVFRNNLEAAAEIARQLRLRDIGGIIVIDFIDMEIRPNREAVITAFRDALSRDKTRTQVFDISELGLVEMTRKRISEGLVESLSDTCPSCHGRGFVFDNDLVGE